MQRPLALLVPLLLLLVASAGCGAPTRYVNIESKPPGATIFVNGEEKGVTPAERIQLVFPAGVQQEVIIQLVKERYRPVFETWKFGEVPSRKKIYTLEED